MFLSLLKVKNNWDDAWKSPDFRLKMLIFLLIDAGILIAFPYFFHWIESRTGTHLSDPLIENIPAIDFSIPVFGIVWGAGLVLARRASLSPQVLLVFLAGYALLTLSRFVSITLLPLEAPQNLIPLVDPLTNYFYAGKYITKDLFFSGHTSTVILIGLCLTERTERAVVLVASVVLGVALLFQHVHYTLDIVAAFPLTYIDFRIAKWLVKQS